jgi:hypothetical protein
MWGKMSGKIPDKMSEDMPNKISLGGNHSQKVIN